MSCRKGPDCIQIIEQCRYMNRPMACDDPHQNANVQMILTFIVGIFDKDFFSPGTDKI